MKKWTHQKFIDNLTLYTKEYTAVDEYICNRSPIKIKHNCGYIFETTPAKIFANKGNCPVCYITHQMTTEIFKLKLLNIWPLFFKEFELLSEYVSHDKSVTIKHLRCGNIYSSTPRDLYRTANTCNKCNGGQRYVPVPLDELINRLSRINTAEYIIVNKPEIINFNSEIKLKHISCGHEYITSFTNLYAASGVSCPVCYRVKKITPELFKLKFEMTELFKSGEYEIVDPSPDNTILKHIKCGHEHNTDYSHVLWFQSGCPKCNTGNRYEKYTHERFISELPPVFLEEYEFLTFYDGYYSPIRIRHKVCGDIIYATPRDIDSQNTRLCSKCYPVIVSYGESSCEKSLMELNLRFKPQYSFDDLKNIRPLRYDFGVYDSTGKLWFLLEFDGIQHYEPVEFFGGTSAFKEVQYLDELKNQYCKEHDIPLLRIHYQDINNITEIINEFIKMRGHL